MKNVVQKSLQGWLGRTGVLAAGAACYVLVLSPMTGSAASSTAITQLKYLQVLIQLSGDSDQFSASSKASDYVQWARNKGMDPSGGWKVTAKLSSDVMAQSLAQLY